jgi:hypothetical protein
VNFYISNFKLFLFSIITTKIILITLFSFILNFYLDIKPNNNQFIEYMKESKSRHMLNKFNFKKYEKIFIGSSKTQYHISRNIFNKKNVSVYNYGISGSFFYAFPFMVEKSMLLNPEEIIISLPITNLYNQNIFAEDFKGILLEDFKYIVKTHSFRESKIAFYEMIKNLYLPFLYAQNINSKINQIYKSFNFRIYKKKSIKNNKKIKKTKDSINSQIYMDCTPFFFGDHAVNCTNGDGILFGSLKNKTKQNKIISLNNENLNINKINLLNLLQDTLNKKNIKLILIFEPSKNKIFRFDKKFLEKKINFKILDANIFEAKDKYWKDMSHFNSIGRKFYTEFLLSKLN